MSIFDYRVSRNNVVNIETGKAVATITRIGEFSTSDGKPLHVRRNAGSSTCDVYVSGYRIGQMNAGYLK